MAEWQLGTAARKAAGGCREQHKCTGACPEEQKRWRGALSPSHVPYFTSGLYRQRQNSGSTCQTQPRAGACTWWWDLLRARSKAAGKILALLQWKGFSHSSEWEQDFCSVFPWDNSREKAFPCSVLPTAPFALEPEGFSWRLRAELKDISQFKACQCLWKTIAGDEVIRSGVIYYPMNVIISCYKYESLPGIVKEEEFMVGVKFLFPWSDPFIA